MIVDVALVMWIIFNLLWTTVLWIAWLKEDDELNEH